MTYSIDDKDKALLHELSKDCRQSDQEIADELGTSKGSITYRRQRLEEHGYIEEYVTLVNQTALGNGYYRLHLRLTGLGADEEFVEWLREREYVHWLTTTEGQYNMLVGIVADSNETFYHHLHEILQVHADTIRSYDVTISIDSPEFGRRYLRPEAESTVTHLTSDQQHVDVDGKDRKILQAVSQDAKATVVDLATASGTTPTVVSHRLKQLRENGVIQTFSTKLDREQLGIRYYKTLFTIYDLTDSLRERLIRFGEEHPHVTYMFFTIGAWTFELNTEVWEHDQYRTVLNELKRELGDRIDEYETLIITKEHKLDYYPFE